MEESATPLLPRAAAPDATRPRSWRRAAFGVPLALVLVVGAVRMSRGGDAVASSSSALGATTVYDDDVQIYVAPNSAREHDDSDDDDFVIKKARAWTGRGSPASPPPRGSCGRRRPSPRRLGGAPSGTAARTPVSSRHGRHPPASRAREDATQPVAREPTLPTLPASRASVRRSHPASPQAACAGPAPPLRHTLRPLTHHTSSHPAPLGRRDRSLARSTAAGPLAQPRPRSVGDDGRRARDGRPGAGGGGGARRGPRPQKEAARGRHALALAHLPVHAAAVVRVLRRRLAHADGG